MYSLKKHIRFITLLGILLVLVMTFAPFAVPPKKAEAQLGAALVGCFDIKGMLGKFGRKATAAVTNMNKVPVFDSAVNASTEAVAGNTSQLTTKECTLDSIGYALAKTIASAMTKSLVAYIKSGFKGDPSFVSNPTEFFKNVANDVTGEYIYENGLDWLCDDFNFDIKTALKLKFELKLWSFEATRKQYKCKITDVIDNVKEFTERGVSFENDLDAVIAISQSNDNPYMMSWNASAAVDAEVNEAQLAKDRELAWGSGFLSPKDANGNITTPGVMIQEQLNKTFGSTFDQLNLSDEFNEIISALMGFAVQALTGPEGIIGSNFEGEGTSGLIDITRAANYTIETPVNAINLSMGETEELIAYVKLDATSNENTKVYLSLAEVDPALNVTISTPFGAPRCDLNSTTEASRTCTVAVRITVEEDIVPGRFNFALMGVSNTQVQKAVAFEVLVDDDGGGDEDDPNATFNITSASSKNIGGAKAYSHAVTFGYDGVATTLNLSIEKDNAIDKDGNTGNNYISNSPAPEYRTGSKISGSNPATTCTLGAENQACAYYLHFKTTASLPSGTSQTIRVVATPQDNPSGRRTFNIRLK